LIAKSANTDARIVMGSQNNFESNTIKLPPLITDAARAPTAMGKEQWYCEFKYRGNVRNKTQGRKWNEVLKFLGNGKL